MSELYGAPVGQLAYEDNQRRNTQSSLQQMEAFGRFAQIPGEMALREAQTRHQDAAADETYAQAAERRARVAAQEAEERLARDWNDEKAARRQASEQAAAQGRLLTLADLPPGGNLTKRSQADDVADFIAYASGRGVSETKLIPFRKEESLIRQQEAAAAHNQARALEQAALARKQSAERYGALATWGLKSEQDYAMMRAEAVNQGLPVNHLPQSWREAQPVLRGIIQSSIAAKDQVEQELKRADDKRADLLARSTLAKNGVEITQIIERTNLIKTRRESLAKTDGPDSPEVQRLKEEEATLKVAERKLKDAALFPSFPANPTDATDGAQYTAKNGARVRAVFNPTIQKGKPGWITFDVITPAPGSKEAAALVKSQTKSKFGRSLLPDEEDE